MNPTTPSPPGGRKTLSPLLLQLQHELQLYTAMIEELNQGCIGPIISTKVFLGVTLQRQNSMARYVMFLGALSNKFLVLIIWLRHLYCRSQVDLFLHWQVNDTLAIVDAPAPPFSSNAKV